MSDTAQLIADYLAAYGKANPTSAVLPEIKDMKNGWLKMRGTAGYWASYRKSDLPSMTARLIARAEISK